MDVWEIRREISICDSKIDDLNYKIPKMKSLIQEQEWAYDNFLNLSSEMESYNNSKYGLTGNIDGLSGKLRIANTFVGKMSDQLRSTKATNNFDWLDCIKFDMKKEIGNNYSELENMKSSLYNLRNQIVSLRNSLVKAEMEMKSI